MQERTMDQMEKEDAWLYVENTYGIQPIPQLPYVVIGVDNEILGRFINKFAALMFVKDSLKLYGRIVEVR